MVENAAAPRITPLSISRLRLPVGANRRGFKVLVFGESGSGKSPLLSCMPGPIFGIDTGEGGLGMYLNKEQDEVYEATHPDKFLELCEYALQNEERFKTIAIDPATAAWEDWMDYWSEKFGGEIKGSQWKSVKGPWKVLGKRLNRSKMNVGQAAWMKDILYEKEEVAPGIEGKLQIRPIEVPQVERKTVYHTDVVLQTSIVLDNKNHPTSKHKITLRKGRRPSAVSPADWHTGKVWTFDSAKPENLWDLVTKKVASNWDMTAVDYMGFDPSEVREAEGEGRDAEEALQDYTVGQIIMLLGQQTNFQIYKDRVWPNEVAGVVNELDAAHKARVMEEHEKTKLRLQGGSK